MPVLIGILFALGLAALIFAAVASLPWVPVAAWLAPVSVVLGLACLVGSWALLMRRHAEAEARLREASLRLDDWASDLRKARTALGDAEQSIQSGQLGTAMAPLLREVLDKVESALPETPDDKARALIAAFRGLATPTEPAPIGLEEMVGESERRASVILGEPLRLSQSIEPHGRIAVDRSRVVGILVQALLGAHDSRPEGASEPIHLEVSEWQAGLLRVVISSPGARPLERGARHGGLMLGAAQARDMGGSLEWQEGTTGDRRFVLLLPLAEEDVRTDPGAPPRDALP